MSNWKWNSYPNQPVMQQPQSQAQVVWSNQFAPIPVQMPHMPMPSTYSQSANTWEPNEDLPSFLQAVPPAVMFAQIQKNHGDKLLVREFIISFDLTTAFILDNPNLIGTLVYYLGQQPGLGEFARMKFNSKKELDAYVDALGSYIHGPQFEGNVQSMIPNVPIASIVVQAFRALDRERVREMCRLISVANKGKAK